MSEDARFEDADGAAAPLRLVALEPDDMPVVSALLQDAVFQSGDLRFDRKGRRFAMLVNRFRWEDRPAAEAAGRAYERVRTLVAVGDVLGVASQGFDRHDPDLVLSLLAVSFVPAGDGAGEVVLTLAGDGAIRLTVECLDIQIRDVTRPYAAPSGRAPDHGDSGA